MDLESLVRPVDKLDSAISREPAGTYSGKVRASLSRGIALGALWFLLSVVLFAVATALAFEAWTLRREIGDQLRETSTKILATRQEPGRYEEFLGIVATVLTPLNTQRDGEENPPTEIQSYFQSYLALVGSGLPARLQPTWEIGPCPEGGFDSVAAARTFGLGAGTCFRRAMGLAFLPPTEGTFKSHCPQLQMPSRTPGDQTNYRVSLDAAKTCISAAAEREQRLKNALEVALLFTLSEPTGQSIVPNFELGPTTPQAYFISPDGVFAHVSNERLTLSIADSQPLSRWEARPYFQAFLSDTDDNPNIHHTRAYLDMTGLGLVETWCHLVRDPETNVRYGIICADKPISPCRLHPEFRGQEDNCEEIISTRDADWLERDWSDGLYIYRLVLARVKNDQFDLSASSLQQSRFETELSKASIEDLKKGPIQNGDEFLVNVGRNRDSVVFLHIRPGSVNDRPDRLMIFALFVLLGSVLSLVKCARQTARASEGAERGTILRNLPTGVLQLDQTQDIMYANDRAEEILRRPLHRFGLLGPPAKLIAFPNLIDDGFVIEILRDQRRIRTPISLDEINKSRQAGISSEYFCRLRGRKAWIQVYGSPILRFSDQRSLTPELSTFGVFEVVPKGLEDLLEALYIESDENPDNVDRDAEPWLLVEKLVKEWFQSEGETGES